MRERHHWDRGRSGGWCALFALLALTGAPALAQLPQPQLEALSRAGGQAGTTVEVSVAEGKELERPQALWFEHPGLQAVLNAADDAAAPPSFHVTIADDVPPGLYDVRVLGPLGLSNPRTFVVGDRPELLDAEDNDDRLRAQPIAVGQTINGRGDRPGDVDWYRFEGRAGETLIAECRAAALDSRMSPIIELFDESGRRIGFARGGRLQDPRLAVRLPADAAYFVKVFDAVYGGGASHLYRLTLHTGPHIEFLLPPAGVPETTSDFTLYGHNLPGGTPARVESDGVELQQLTVSIALPAESERLEVADVLPPSSAGIDAVTYRLESPHGLSNAVTIALVDLPPTSEQEPNGPESPQHVALPVELVGQFQQRGDADAYVFDARTGDVWNIEVFGHRTGVNIDPHLVVEQVLEAADGTRTYKRLAAIDDEPAIVVPGLFDSLASEDPAYRLEAPADGLYRVVVQDRYAGSRAGHHLVYRLSIRRKRPDFRLAALPVPTLSPDAKTALPWEAVLRRGDSVAIQVFAFRQGGFDEPIRIQARDLPKGVSATESIILPGEVSAQIVLKSWKTAAVAHGAFRIEGTALIQLEGQQYQQHLRRTARPLTVLRGSDGGWPAAARIGRTLAVSVVEDETPFHVDFNQSNQVAVFPGRRELELPLSISDTDRLVDEIKLNVQGLPKGVTAEFVSKPRSLLRIKVDDAVPVGAYALQPLASGNVRIPSSSGGAKNQQLFRPLPPLVLHVLPTAPIAVHLEDLERRTVRPGETFEVRVRVERDPSYRGPVHLWLLTAGKTAILDPVRAVIAPLEDTGVLVATVPPDAAPGDLQNVRVEAMVVAGGIVRFKVPLLLTVAP